MAWRGLHPLDVSGSAIVARVVLVVDDDPLVLDVYSVNAGGHGMRSGNCT